MKDLGISRKKALNELLWFSCQNGNIENFKDIVNFCIKSLKNDKQESEKKL